MAKTYDNELFKQLSMVFCGRVDNNSIKGDQKGKTYPLLQSVL